MDHGRPQPSSEGGFTLVELLVAVSLMMGVLTVSLAALTSLERNQRKGTDRADALATTRAGVERLTRELRQASAVTTFSASASVQRLDVVTWVHVNGSVAAQSETVSYVCTQSTKACTRQVIGVDAAARPLMTNLTNAASVLTGVPSSSTAASFIKVDATVQLRNAKTITLSDGVELRNKAAA